MPDIGIVRTQSISPCESWSEIFGSGQPSLKAYWMACLFFSLARPYASYVQYAAATFLHRFYMRFALQDFPIKVSPNLLLFPSYHMRAALIKRAR